MDLSPFINNIPIISDPAQRLWWGSLITASLLALIWTQGPVLERCRSLFHRRVWLHRSSQIDILLLTVNSLLKLAIATPVFLMMVGFASLVSSLLTLTFGPHLQLTNDAVWPVLIFGFCSFLVEDWSRWLLHYFQHTSKLLWRFHKVHHSATVLTPFTLHRTHPVEVLCAQVRHIISFGLITGVFSFMFNDQLDLITVLGVDAFGFAFNFLGANLRHSHIHISYGRWEKIFISPAQHQMHHLQRIKLPTNLGSCFAIWDLLAGTIAYAPRKKPKVRRFGISRSQSRA